MTEHNSFKPLPGKICVYGEWTGSEYVEYQGYIRAVLSTPAGPDEPIINLTYNDGIGGANQANNVTNIELITGNENYWRAQFDPSVPPRPFVTGYRPASGEVVWIAKYDPTAEEHYFFLAVVRALTGPPTDQTPTANLSFFDARPGVDQDTNANNVVPVEEFSGGTEDYWFKATGISA